MRRKDHESVVHELRRELQAVRKERDDALDRLMAMANRPWTLPPADLPLEIAETERELSDPEQRIEEFEWPVAVNGDGS